MQNQIVSLLTTDDAAALLGVKKSSLETWRSRPPRGGGPRFIRIGGAVRYDPVDLQEFIDKHRRAHTTDPGLGVSEP